MTARLTYPEALAVVKQFAKAAAGRALVDGYAMQLVGERRPDLRLAEIRADIERRLRAMYPHGRSHLAASVGLAEVIKDRAIELEARGVGAA
jgi:hypothetical protein